jgi:hypothetical protein
VVAHFTEDMSAPFAGLSKAQRRAFLCGISLVRALLETAVRCGKWCAAATLNGIFFSGPKEHARTGQAAPQLCFRTVVWTGVTQ